MNITDEANKQEDSIAALTTKGIIEYEVTLTEKAMDYRINSNLAGKMAAVLSVRDELQKLQDFAYSKEGKHAYSNVEKKNIISARFLMEKISNNMAKDVFGTVIEQQVKAEEKKIDEASS